MDLLQGVSIKGEIEVRVIEDKTGRILEQFKKSNLVCNGAKEAMVRLLAQASLHGGSPSNEDFEETKLWAIYVGTGTTAPVVTDTDLETPVFKKACDQPFSVNTTTGVVEVQMTIATGEANGNTLTEVGLFTRGDNDDPNLTSDDLLFARQIHGAIAKTSSISIEYTWRVQIST